MTNNFWFKLLGAILFFSGISLIINPVWYSSKYSVIFDYSEIKWPYGLFMSVIGLWLFIHSIKNKIEQYICPNCDSVHERNKKKPGQCPTCASNLKKLEGFYESGINNKTTSV